jgi:hypothetical protein
MGTQGKKGAVGPNGRRGARGVAGPRGKIGKVGPKGPRGSTSSHQTADLLNGFVANFDDVYRQLTGLRSLIGHIQRQINELAARADVDSRRA